MATTQPQQFVVAESQPDGASCGMLGLAARSAGEARRSPARATRNSSRAQSSAAAASSVTAKTAAAWRDVQSVEIMQQERGPPVYVQ